MAESFHPWEVVQQVRTLLQDDLPDTFLVTELDPPPLLRFDAYNLRYTQRNLLGFFNDAMQRVAIVRPDLFTRYVTITEYDPVSPTKIRLDDAIRIIEVLRAYDDAGQTAPFEVDKMSMDRSAPDWHSHPRGLCRNWMRNQRIPQEFFIYPPPTSVQRLEVSYTRSPPRYTSLQSLVVDPGRTYQTALVDYMMYLCESADDEHVLSGRAEMFKSNFETAMGISAESRILFDKEEAGVPPAGGPSG